MRLPRAALALALTSPALLLPAVAIAAPSTFVLPPAPSVFAKNVTVGQSATTFTGDAVLDTGRVAHLAWVSKSTGGGDQLTVCTYPRGAKACSATSNLLPPDAAQNVDLGTPQVVLDSPNTLEVFATTCCATGGSGNPTVVRWTSPDNGTTWTLAPDSLSLSAIDASTMVGDQLVVVGAKADGTVLEQIRNPSTGATAVLPIGTSGDPGIGPKVAAAGGDILVASDSAPAGQPEATTVTRQQALAGDTFGAPTAITFSGETPMSLAAGFGGPYLLTRQDSGGLDPTVLLRRWNGSSFNAPLKVPAPGKGDDKNFQLAVDGFGRLDVIFTGARENYRMWREVSTNGGKTWTSTLLDNNVNGAGFYPVLDAAGIGLVLEVPAGGTGSVIVQPLLVTPTFSLKGARLTHLGLTKDIVFTGKVGSPSPAALVGSVSIQKLTGKHWTTIGTEKIGKTGSFRFTFKPGTPGSANRYRAYTNGVYGFYDIGTSAPVTIRIPKL